MQVVYYDADDILHMKFNDKPITREVSRDWNVTISYAADGDVVEVVVLDAKESGLYAILTEQRKAA